MPFRPFVLFVLVLVRVVCFILIHFLRTSSSSVGGVGGGAIVTRQAAKKGGLRQIVRILSREEGVGSRIMIREEG